MCTQNGGLHNLLWKSLLKISDVYTGFVEIRRDLRRSKIQIVTGIVAGNLKSLNMPLYETSVSDQFARQNAVDAFGLCDGCTSMDTTAADAALMNM
jgi:hypothetical protein